MALHFTDILIESGLTERGEYQYVFVEDNEPVGDPTDLGSSTRIPLQGDASGIIHCRVRQKKLGSDEWSNWANAFVRMNGVADEAELVGLLRRE